jgi:hypothetical protein
MSWTPCSTSRDSGSRAQGGDDQGLLILLFRGTSGHTPPCRVLQVGELKLDELISRTISLNDVNDALVAIETGDVAGVSPGMSDPRFTAPLGPMERILNTSGQACPRRSCAPEKRT